MIAAGELDQRIAFECRASGNPDADGEAGPDYGNTEGEFAEQFVLWAKRVFLRGTESVMASRLQGRQPVVFTVRASSQSRQITTDWQARDKRTGAVYAIRGVTPSPDRAGIDILAEGGVAS